MVDDTAPAAQTSLGSSIREIQAVFDDQARLDDAIDRLRLAGFDRAELGLPAPTLHPSDATPEGSAANPDTPVDRQQVRTLAGSAAGITAAMIGAGVTIGTGGAAALAAGVAVAAGALAGGATHAATAAGTEVETATRAARANAGTLVLAVTVRDSSQEQLAADTLRAAGAVRVEPVSRADATVPRD